MTRSDELNEVRNWFGVYAQADRFDRSVTALLDLDLPVWTVIEIVGGIWREARDATLEDW